LFNLAKAKAIAVSKLKTISHCIATEIHLYSPNNDGIIFHAQWTISQPLIPTFLTIPNSNTRLPKEIWEQAAASQG